MTKPKPLNIIKWYLPTAAAGVGFGASALWLADSLGWSQPHNRYEVVVSGMLLWTSGNLYYRLMAQREDVIPLRQKPALGTPNARAIPINSGGKSGSILLNSVASIFGTTPRRDNELWYTTYGPYIIRESLLYEFWRKGWNRQLMTHPHPFSQKWMLRQSFAALGCRIDKGLYDGLCTITGEYGLWLSVRRQGASGKIAHSPAGCLARVKGRWY